MNDIRYKSYTSDNNSFNEQERSIVSFISTISPDRYNEIVLPEGVNTNNYEKNPIVLLNHNSPLPIGKNLWIKKIPTGLQAKTQFADTELANDVMKLYRDGFMRAFSIGFLSKVRDIDKEKRLIHKDSELLEYSAVTIPANADALMLSYKSVQTPFLKELLEKEIKEVEIYEKIENMQNEIYKAMSEQRITDKEEITNALKTISELNDKVNQLNETLNQLQSEKKKVDYQKQIEKKLEDIILNKLNLKI